MVHSDGTQKFEQLLFHDFQVSVNAVEVPFEAHYSLPQLGNTENEHIETICRRWDNWFETVGNKANRTENNDVHWKENLQDKL